MVSLSPIAVFAEIEDQLFPATFALLIAPRSMGKEGQIRSSPLELSLKSVSIQTAAGFAVSP
jgi:hypothetical protein